MDEKIVSAYRPKRERILSKRRLKMDYPLYLLLLPPVVFLFVFSYIPMVGILIAFQRYLPAKGMLASPWVGLTNFVSLFTMPGFYNALRNTLLLSIYKIAFGIIVPVAFTIMLNEISVSLVKRGVQTLIYLPHFVSWVLLAGIFIKLLGGSGLVNQILGRLGISPIIFLGDNRWFRFTLVLTHIWKEFGYGTIVYLAAIAGVNADLYEAAQIDGAGHWKQMIHVTLPAITPIILLMTALSIGGILSAGFDQVFNLYNSLVMPSADIIDTYVYRIGLVDMQYSFSTAVNVSKSVVAIVLVLSSNWLVGKLSDYTVF